MNQENTYVKRLQKAKSFFQQKHYQEAFIAFEALTKDFPDKAEPLSYCGRCVAALGDLVYAMSYFLKAIELEPENADHHVYVGHCLNSTGQKSSALNEYNKALKFDPKNLEALSALGTLLVASYNDQEAIDILSRALNIKPSNADNNSNFSLALARTGNYEDAVKHANRAIKSEPNNSYGYYVLGSIYQMFGNEQEAKKNYVKAMDIDPTNGSIYYAFVAAKKVTKDDIPVVRKMEKVLEQSMPATSREQFLFALAKAYDDLKQPDKAIKYVSKGNMLIHSDYDPKKHSKYIRRLKNYFDKNYFSSRKPLPTESYTPIFIVGLPRSGSTLIDQILSNHTKVHSAGESLAMPEIISAVSSHDQHKNQFPECLGNFKDEDFKNYKTAYLDKISRDVLDKTYYVDKNLFNYQYLGFIATIFKNARIINTLRNPLDTSFSCYLTGFNFTESFWTHNQEYIGKYYRDYVSIMEHWRSVLPIPILDVQYEDIVNDTESSVKRILDFCNLEWEENCLEFYKSKRSVTTASHWQVRQPIYKSAMQRWIPYAKYLQPLILALGDLIENDYELIESLGLKHGPRRNSLRGKLSKLFT